MRRIHLEVLLVAIVVATSCSPIATTSRPSDGADPSIELVVTTDVGAELRFVPDVVTAPARTAIRIDFRNRSTQAHNLTFEGAIDGRTRTIVEAGGSDIIDLVTPAAGRYEFVCTIHAGMAATLVVR